MIGCEKWKNGEGAPAGDEKGNSIQMVKERRKTTLSLFDKASKDLILFLSKITDYIHVTIYNMCVYIDICLYIHIKKCFNRICNTNIIHMHEWKLYINGS